MPTIARYGSWKSPITSELIVASYFGAHKLKYKIVTFASAEQAWNRTHSCPWFANPDDSSHAASFARLSRGAMRSRSRPPGAEPTTSSSSETASSIRCASSCVPDWCDDVSVILARRVSADA